MLIYRTQVETIETAAEMRRLRDSVRDPMDLLIRVGQLESAVVDWLFRTTDGEHPTARALRRASLAAARLLRTPSAAHRDVLAAALDCVADCELPPRAELSVPEGYAYYGLYPQTYYEAALRFFRDRRPHLAVVIGIRSIGTSLSAVVQDALEYCGCAVESWTVRPRGHPFDRRIALAPEMEQRLPDLQHAEFAIVDEGPGLSGSSFASVAAAISELGVPDRRISFFPSWVPDGSSFRSTAARERWPLHAKYSVPWEEITAPGEAVDISAGEWRNHFLDGVPWPAVQPQHERRKFLTQGSLRRFAGLGRFGAVKHERAVRLYEQGFSPRPLAIANGFLELERIAGRPLSIADARPELLAAMARYLRCLRTEPASSTGAGFDELAEMIAVNTGGAVNPRALEHYRPAVSDAPACAIDGRLLPHEWLETTSGYCKTDALDHYDGHFLPGCQDIAWDVAGAGVEFDLAGTVLTDFAKSVEGPGLADRLPFYRIAYLAFRIGYTALAREAIAGTADAARFETLERRYRAQIKEALPCR